MKPLLKFVIWSAVVLAIFVAALETFGTDINKGYAFTPTDRVTNTKLNNLVDLASINTDFIHLQTSVFPATADEVLLYQSTSGLYRKATIGNLLFGNTNLIMGQSENTAVATNDFFLLYDTSGGSLQRVADYNLWPSIGGLNELTAGPDIGYKMLIVSPTGQPYWSAMTNTLNQAYRHWQLANPSNTVSAETNYYLANRGVPVWTDALIIWGNGPTNYHTTLSNLVTQSTACTTATGGDMAWGYSTNQSQIVAFKMVDIQKWTTNSANSPTLALTNKLPQTFTSSLVGLGNGLLLNTAHGLGGTPQCVRWVLVQTNSVADQGWGQNREVDIYSFVNSSGVPWFATEADGTVVILVAPNSGTLQVRNASTGALGNVDTSKWVAKVYATYFPTFP